MPHLMPNDGHTYIILLIKIHICT